MKAKKIHLFYFLSIVVVMICSSMQAVAQNMQSVTGKVVDQNNETLIGATVVIKGTNTGVTTTMDGTFELSVPKGDAVLVVSYIGYQTQEVTVGTQSNLNIVLKSDDMGLEEIVVIGYGTQTKATVTGALSTVPTEALVAAPVASITNVLAGTVPGISSVQETGQPGADAASIYIRGIGTLGTADASPLVLVDGIERPLSQIDPNEIENFSILKDAASTAVFGVRGANGVIVITTKRGKVGAPKISISSDTGVQQPMGYMNTVGSYEYATFWNMKEAGEGETNPKRYFTADAIEAYRTGSDPIIYPNVNWGEEVFNNTFLQTKNNINISGGTEDVRYFVSLGHLFQDGILKQIDVLPYNNNYKYERFNYRANLDFKLTKTTNMKFNVGGFVGSTQEPNAIQGIEHSWTYTYLWTLPFASPGLIDGKRSKIPDKFVYDNGNIVRDGYSGFYGYGYQESDQTMLNVDTEINQNLDVITEGLSVSIKGGIDNTYLVHKNRSGGGMEWLEIAHKSYYEDTSKPTTDLDYDKTVVYIPKGQDTPLTLSSSYGKDRNWYLEGRINYSRAFGDHTTSAMFLYNQSRNYYPASLPYNYIPRSYIGYVGRATYGYKGKYLADVNVGYNGSENFAPGSTRYGLFPAVSAAWVMTSEPFMRSVEAISYLKLRASFGKVGNDKAGTSRFMYVPGTWNPSGSYSFGIDNPTNVSAYGYGVPGNEDVTWETALKQNYGFDLNMFNDRLSLTAEYFFEDRTGILITPNTTPSVIATGLPALNLGEVENQGYELMLGWQDNTSKDFSYNILATFSYSRNKIIYMDEVRKEFEYQNQTGGPTGRQGLMYEYVRLYQYSDFTQDANGELVLDPNLPKPFVNVSPGDAMYADLNGDGVVNDSDKTYAGYSKIPQYIFGLNGGFTYKNFNFRMQWTGATNVDRMMEVEYRKPFGNSSMMGLVDFHYTDTWTEDRQNGTLPRVAEATEAWNRTESTLWLRDASYLRLKTLTVSYTFKSAGLKKATGLSSIGVSLSGYNLLTFSPMKFMDPESVASNLGRYPLVKNYSLGINLNF